MENACYNFSEPNMTHSDCLFYQTISSKPRYLQFIIIYDKEKHKILTFQDMEAKNFCSLRLKNEWSDESIVNIAAD